ncbi:MAG: hypothetical protein GXO54_04850 [Chloroflexi bacterium]|nr:hypothetical protein [Chloroflexota bacterium]
MSALWIWWLFPLGVGLGLGLWPRGTTRQKARVAVVLNATLALAAALLPIDRVVPVLGYRVVLHLTPEMSILGRTFLWLDGQRPWLVALFGAAALWALAAPGARLAPDVPAWTLILPAGVVGALAAQDLLLALLILGLLGLAVIFLWVPPGRPTATRGPARYLAIWVLGLPLVLLTLSLLTGLETATWDNPDVRRAMGLMAIALALWMGLFPFHPVYPLLGESAHPARLLLGWHFLHVGLGLVLLRMPTVYLWIRETTAVYQGLRALAWVMIGVAGTLLPFQRHLGRAVGYAHMLTLGWSLLAWSLGSDLGPTAFWALYWPRTLWSVAWGWGLAVLALPHDQFDEATLTGQGRDWLPGALLAIAGLLAVAPWPGLPWWPGVAYALHHTGTIAWYGLVALGFAWVGSALTGARWARILLAPRGDNTAPPIRRWPDRAWAWLALAAWLGFNGLAKPLFHWATNSWPF